MAKWYWISKLYFWCTSCRWILWVEHLHESRPVGTSGSDWLQNPTCYPPWIKNLPFLSNQWCNLFYQTVWVHSLVVWILCLVFILMHRVIFLITLCSEIWAELSLPYLQRLCLDPWSNGFNDTYTRKSILAIKCSVIMIHIIYTPQDERPLRNSS